LQQLILGDERSAALDQRDEQVEGMRPEPDFLTAREQAAFIGLQFEVSEAIPRRRLCGSHCAYPPTRGQRKSPTPAIFRKSLGGPKDFPTGRGETGANEISRWPIYTLGKIALDALNGRS